MAVLMLEFYERISNATRLQSSSGAHRGGAVALVEHRGSLNFQSETGKRLLVAVRHELIDKALERVESISPNPAPWRNSAPMPESPAIALVALMVELANLKAYVDTVDFPDPPSMSSNSSGSPSRSRLALRLMVKVAPNLLLQHASLPQSPKRAFTAHPATSTCPSTSPDSGTNIAQRESTSSESS